MKSLCILLLLLFAVSCFHTTPKDLCSGMGFECGEWNATTRSGRTVPVVCGTCTGGKKCEYGHCVCKDTDSRTCHDGDVYWVSSCGYRQFLAIECKDGCKDGECVKVERKSGHTVSPSSTSPDNIPRPTPSESMYRQCVDSCIRACNTHWNYPGCKSDCAKNCPH